MPQTREHLAILDLLQVKRGIVVLTKADTVDEEWADLVRDEVAEALRDTTLDGAPMCLVSAVTGQGLPELTALIDDMLVETVRREDLGRPRLSIDRSFIMPGFGTVVTGTLLDGALTVGQEVELLPSGLRRRIRGLQSHQHRIESVGPGNRVAVNLANTTQEEAERGQVLTLPGWLQPTRTADVQLRMVPAAPVPLRHNLGVTFHSGSSETFARVRLLDVAELRPGQDGWAQVHLAEPLPLVKGDYFVLRSSQWTLGGGRIVDPHPARHRRYQLGVLEKLEVMAEGAPEDLVLKALESAEPCGIAALARAANFAVADTTALVAELALQGEVVVLGGAARRRQRRAYDNHRLGEDSRAGGRRGAGLPLGEPAAHRTWPRGAPQPAEAPARRRSRTSCSGSPTRGVLEETGAVVRAPGHRVTLSDAQEAEAARYVAGAGARALRAAPRSCSSTRRCWGCWWSAAAWCVWRTGWCLRRARTGRCSNAILAHLREHGAITVADVRDAFGTSRKYALPLLEHLDQQHITAPAGRPAGAASRPGALVMQERVYGVDFSGARAAGKKIWIAQAVPRGRGIMVEACSPSTEFLALPAPNGERCSPRVARLHRQCGRRGIWM